MDTMKTLIEGMSELSLEKEENLLRRLKWYEILFTFWVGYLME